MIINNIIQVDYQPPECCVMQEPIEGIAINLPCGKSICFTVFQKFYQNSISNRFKCPITRKPVFLFQLSCPLFNNENLILNTKQSKKDDLEKQISNELREFNRIIEESLKDFNKKLKKIEHFESYWLDNSDNEGDSYYDSSEEDYYSEEEEDDESSDSEDELDIINNPENAINIHTIFEEPSYVVSL